VRRSFEPRRGVVNANLPHLGAEPQEDAPAGYIGSGDVPQGAA
jgi:hypothetical protein